jgi:hypothetical protein
VPRMYHPWHHLRSRPEITLHWADLEPGTLALTDGQDIWMSPHPLQAWRRCTLAHELAHIELGHRHGCTERDEAEAAQLAARRLISASRLADALLWSQNLEVVAEALWVDIDTLEVRLAHLHPSERALISDRLAAREDGV